MAHGLSRCAAQVHNLSGPIEVTDTKGEPAHPGDLLVVEILNLGALEGDEWGFTGTFDRENGGGHPQRMCPYSTLSQGEALGGS